jgi:glycosyltransferase involved in cell wall biosynthesis
VSRREHAVSVVVPVFNAMGRLEELVRRIDDVLAETPHELVLVNDGSADDTWVRIVAVSGTNPRVRGLDLMRNYGQHNALLAGVRAARNPVTVTLDDDLQNPPEEIPKLLEALTGGADLVYGSPHGSPRGVRRRFATWLTRLALRAAIGSHVATRVSTFRAFRTDLRRAFEDFRGPDVSIDVLLSWGARTTVAVPVAHAPPVHGGSSYTFGRLSTHALNVLTGFSTRPLRLASLIGLVFTLFGAAVLVLVVVRYFADAGNRVPGFPFLASIVAIFSGVQLMTLGVIGEYLARMHARTLDRPVYAVRDQVGAG